jgi:hypothetical protein
MNSTVPLGGDGKKLAVVEVEELETATVLEESVVEGVAVPKL